jgi:exodeoxyribonuclease VII large subunit
VYFALKDETAKLSAILWRSDALRLAFALEEGMQVVATGTLGLYPARGQFQMQVSSLQPVGVGAMQVALEQLKRKLSEEGLFDPGRKRPLPFLPRRVGVVTSPQGAAIRDIVNVLKRRHPDLRVTIFPARVQGEGAVGQLIEGIRVLARLGCDVVVLARGGGSAEDLASFNDERLARAVAASSVPTISAVGHETDWTLVDFVADVRAATPSAAAEIVVGAKEEIVRRVGHARRGLAQLCRRKVAEVRERLSAAERAESLVRFRYALLRRRDRFDAAREALQQIVGSRPMELGRRAARAEERLSAAARLLRFERRRGDVERPERSIAERMPGRALPPAAPTRLRRGPAHALDPLAILARGYAVVYREGAPDLRSPPPRDIRAGERLRIRLARAASGGCGRIFPHKEAVEEVIPDREGETR